MMRRVARPLLLTAGLLGVVAGLRSQLPQAALAARGLEPTSGPLSVLRSGVGRRAAYVAAVGELVIDKLPSTPSRVAPRGLAGRIASGAVAGASLASASGRRGAPLILPAVFGAVGAYAGSWGGYSVRKAVVTASRLPDPVVAVGEDLLAVGLVAAVVPRGAG